MERPQGGRRPRQRAGPGRGRTTLTPTSEAQGSGGEDAAVLSRRRGRLMVAHRVVSEGQSGSIASDQHQPASSRATATLAATGRFFRSE
jgi:hypothetical protein